ncbi:MAG: CNNM domain-containing protein [Phycisphaerales bacterium]|jgi:CBS domain containing-hemolysin-like protein
MLKYTLLVFMPLLLLASAICSASETALFSLSQADRLRLRKSHPMIFAAVSELLASPRSLLISVLLANAVVNTTFLVLSTVLGSAFSPAWAALIGAATVLVVIIGGEVLPKSVAAVYRVAVCRLVAIPMRVWFRVSAPIRIFAEDFVVSPLVRVFSPGGTPTPPISTEDLSALLELNATAGVLNVSDQQLLDDVVQLSTLRAKDVMTPRVDLRWLSVTSTSDDFLALAGASGPRRLPVSRRGISERAAVGFVRDTSVLAQLKKSGGAKVPLASLVEPALYLPERSRLDQVLEQFRAAKTDVALCVNEVGDITGVIALDDLIRELVSGADDSGSTAGGVERIMPGEWFVPGRLSVRDWASFFGAGDEEINPRVSTVAGLVLDRLGRVPRVGDEVRIRNVRLRVERMRGRVIEQVAVAVQAPAEAQP